MLESPGRCNENFGRESEVKKEAKMSFILILQIFFLNRVRTPPGNLEYSWIFIWNFSGPGKPGECFSLKYKITPGKHLKFAAICDHVAHNFVKKYTCLHRHFIENLLSAMLYLFLH